MVAVKVEVVFHFARPAAGRPGHDFITVSKKGVRLAAMPFVGAAIEYQDDWALATVNSVYIGSDHVQANCEGSFTDEEMDTLIGLGWTVRGRVRL